MLPDDIVDHIVSFLDLTSNVKYARFINKQFLTACFQGRLWKHLTLDKIHPNTLGGMIDSHGQHVESLKLSHCRLTRKVHTKISAMQNLVLLNLKHVYSSSLVDDRFCYLIRKSSLQSLLLGSSSITDVGVETLKELSLKEFELHSSCYVTNAAIESLRHWKRLSRLTLFAIDGITSIQKLACLSLAVLNVSFCRNLEAQSVTQFCSVENKKLRTFLLYGFYFTKPMLKLVSRSFVNLESFSLCHIRVGQREYNELRHMKKLQYLSLICCGKIRDLRFLKKIRLKRFYLCNTEIDFSSRANFKKSLMYLKQCNIRLSNISATDHSL